MDVDLITERKETDAISFDENLVSQLELLNAKNIAHLDGPLLQHLKGTCNLLKQWGARDSLCNAGLYHAVYGTAGFEKLLISNTKRNMISSIIGCEAEKIVYIYCAASRDYFWPQIGVANELSFLDRFTGKYINIDSQQLEDFCELTVANEIEIAADNPTFIKQYGTSLIDLFTRMKPYVSFNAYSHFQKTLIRQ